MHHPCQAMADMMTIRERFGRKKKKVLLTWAWHPKPLPMAVPNSFALAAAQFGHDLRIAHPTGYELDDELLSECENLTKSSGGSIEIINNVNEAFDEVDVVYAKSWGSKQFYGALETEMAFRADLRNSWIVNAENMSKTKDAIFMHCLPVRRNVVVTDEVIDSELSLVIDEAENRLHVQKAILTSVLG
jgi:N-acetylornithine carbamoyltransferase